MINELDSYLNEFKVFIKIAKSAEPGSHPSGSVRGDSLAFEIVRSCLSQPVTINSSNFLRIFFIEGRDK